MSNHLNPDQQAAVSARGQNILVFASAGGGKTTVLVQRLLERIVKDRVDLSAIAAMTFTEAAAANMQKRLQKALSEALAKDPEDAFLKRQLTLVADANISTIHSFCLSVIKEFYYVIGLPRSAAENILDDGHRALDRQQAAEEVLQETDAAELNRLLSGSLFSRQTLIEALLKISEKAAASADPLRWFAERRHCPAQSYEELPQELRDPFFREIKDRLRLCRAPLQECLHSAPEALQTDYQTIVSLTEDLLQEEDYPSFLLRCRSFPKLPGVRKKKGEEDTPELLRFKNARDEAAVQMKKIAGSLSDPGKLLRAWQASLPYEEQLLQLSEQLFLRYRQIKQRHDCLDFGDFEHYAYAILTAHDGMIADQLASRYQEIMVDEFQDTSESQWQLISLLARDDLFLVGDVKQSIYRFRNAKPAIMQRLNEDPSFRKIHIRSNYRSKANIISFNNALFSQLMNLRGTAFDESDAQRDELDAQREGNVPVRFLRMHLPEGVRRGGRLLRAQGLAQEILKAHEEGTEFRDMAVLLRSHGEKAEVRSVFRRCGIPYFIKDREGFFASAAMDCLLSWYKLLLDPSDRFARTAVLVSPAYGLSDDELLRQKDQLWQIEPLASDLKTLQPLADAGRLCELTQAILALHDLYDKLPPEEETNLNYFLEKLPSYGFTTLREMTSFIEDTKEEQLESASAVSEEAPVVKVMTIHNSKGLEYDSVFLLTGHRSLQQEKHAVLVCDEDLGIGFSLVDPETKETYPTLNRRAILAKDDLEDLQEYQRLLYVALTRAKRRLVMIDAFEKDEDYAEGESLLYQRKGASSYLSSLMGEDPLLEIIDQEEEPQLYRLPTTIAEQQELPHKDFRAEMVENLSPSSFEEHELALNFEAIKGMDYGTRIHEVFARIDYRWEVDESALLAIDPSLTPKELQMILSFSRSPLIRGLQKDHEFVQEYSFYERKKGSLLHGFMDFLAIGEDDLVLFDYKTDVNVTDEELIRRYLPQQKSYAAVLRRAYPQKQLKAYLYSTANERFIELHWEQD